MSSSSQHSNNNTLLNRIKEIVFQLLYVIERNTFNNKHILSIVQILEILPILYYYTNPAFVHLSNMHVFRQFHDHIWPQIILFVPNPQPIVSIILLLSFPMILITLLVMKLLIGYQYILIFVIELFLLLYPLVLGKFTLDAIDLLIHYPQYRLIAVLLTVVHIAGSIGTLHLYSKKYKLIDTLLILLISLKVNHYAIFSLIIARLIFVYFLSQETLLKQLKTNIELSLLFILASSYMTSDVLTNYISFVFVFVAFLVSPVLGILQHYDQYGNIVMQHYGNVFYCVENIQEQPNIFKVKFYDFLDQHLKECLDLHCSCRRLVKINDNQEFKKQANNLLNKIYSFKEDFQAKIQYADICSSHFSHRLSGLLQALQHSPQNFYQQYQSYYVVTSYEQEYRRGDKNHHFGQSYHTVYEDLRVFEQKIETITVILREFWLTILGFDGSKKFLSMILSISEQINEISALFNMYVQKYQEHSHHFTYLYRTFQLVILNSKESEDNSEQLGIKSLGSININNKQKIRVPERMLFFVADEQTQIVNCNREFCNFLQVDRGQVLGKSYNKLVPKYCQQEHNVWVGEWFNKCDMEQQFTQTIKSIQLQNGYMKSVKMLTKILPRFDQGVQTITFIKLINELTTNNNTKSIINNVSQSISNKEKQQQYEQDFFSFLIQKQSMRIIGIDESFYNVVRVKQCQQLRRKLLSLKVNQIFPKLTNVYLKKQNRKQLLQTKQKENNINSSDKQTKQKQKQMKENSRQLRQNRQLRQYRQIQQSMPKQVILNYSVLQQFIIDNTNNNNFHHSNNIYGINNSSEQQRKHNYLRGISMGMNIKQSSNQYVFLYQIISLKNTHLQTQHAIIHFKHKHKSVNHHLNKQKHNHNNHGNSHHQRRKSNIHNNNMENNQHHHQHDHQNKPYLFDNNNQTKYHHDPQQQQHYKDTIIEDEQNNQTIQREQHNINNTRNNNIKKRVSKSSSSDGSDSYKGSNNLNKRRDSTIVNNNTNESNNKQTATPGIASLAYRQPFIRSSKPYTQQDTKDDNYQISQPAHNASSIQLSSSKHYCLPYPIILPLIIVHILYTYVIHYHTSILIYLSQTFHFYDYYQMTILKKLNVIVGRDVSYLDGLKQLWIQGYGFYQDSFLIFQTHTLTDSYLTARLYSTIIEHNHYGIYQQISQSFTSQQSIISALNLAIILTLCGFILYVLIDFILNLRYCFRISSQVTDIVLIFLNISQMDIRKLMICIDQYQENVLEVNDFGLIREMIKRQEDSYHMNERQVEESSLIGLLKQERSLIGLLKQERSIIGGGLLKKVNSNSSRLLSQLKSVDSSSPSNVDSSSPSNLTQQQTKARGLDSLYNSPLKSQEEKIKVRLKSQQQQKVIMMNRVNRQSYLKGYKDRPFIRVINKSQSQQRNRRTLLSHKRKTTIRFEKINIDRLKESIGFLQSVQNSNDYNENIYENNENIYENEFISPIGSEHLILGKKKSSFSNDSNNRKSSYGNSFNINNNIINNKNSNKLQQQSSPPPNQPPFFKQTHNIIQNQQDHQSRRQKIQKFKDKFRGRLNDIHQHPHLYGLLLLVLVLSVIVLLVAIVIVPSYVSTFKTFEERYFDLRQMKVVILKELVQKITNYTLLPQTKPSIYAQNFYINMYDTLDSLPAFQSYWQNVYTHDACPLTKNDQQIYSMCKSIGSQTTAYGQKVMLQYLQDLLRRVNSSQLFPLPSQLFSSSSDNMTTFIKVVNLQIYMISSGEKLIKQQILSYQQSVRTTQVIIVTLGTLTLSLCIILSRRALNGILSKIKDGENLLLVMPESIKNKYIEHVRRSKSSREVQQLQQNSHKLKLKLKHKHKQKTIIRNSSIISKEQNPYSYQSPQQHLSEQQAKSPSHEQQAQQSALELIVNHSSVLNKDDDEILKQSLKNNSQLKLNSVHKNPTNQSTNPKSKFSH